MKRLLVLIVFLALFIIGGFIWWGNGLKAVDLSDNKEKIFVIQKGTSIREIANNLKKEGLIRDPVVFFLYIRFLGKDTSIQAGDYRLSSSMDAYAIVNTLSHGTLDVWMTFPEGLRGEEVADVVKKNLAAYDDSWQKVFIENTGYLFPDTYLIPKDATSEQIVLIMKENFAEKINSLGLHQDSSTLSNIIVLASLIEREAKTNEEKPIIAGVLTNRLKEGIPLQVDATIQYAKGYDKETRRWWGSVFSSDYKRVQSPFNTYLYVGLPPRPIANPGLEAIRAAANPSQTKYYYYLHDRNGGIHFAETLLEHNRNKERYIAQ